MRLSYECSWKSWDIHQNNGGSDVCLWFCLFRSFRATNGGAQKAFESVAVYCDCSATWDNVTPAFHPQQHLHHLLIHFSQSQQHIRQNHQDHAETIFVEKNDGEWQKSCLLCYCEGSTDNTAYIIFYVFLKGIRRRWRRRRELTRWRQGKTTQGRR